MQVVVASLGKVIDLDEWTAKGQCWYSFTDKPFSHALRVSAARQPCTSRVR